MLDVQFTNIGIPKDYASTKEHLITAAKLLGTSITFTAEVSIDGYERATLAAGVMEGGYDLDTKEIFVICVDNSEDPEDIKDLIVYTTHELAHRIQDLDNPGQKMTKISEVLSHEREAQGLSLEIAARLFDENYIKSFASRFFKFYPPKINNNLIFLKAMKESGYEDDVSTRKKRPKNKEQLSIL